MQETQSQPVLTPSRVNNIDAIDTLRNVTIALRSIETQIMGFIESPSELSENDFDFTTIHVAEKRIEAVVKYLEDGVFRKEITIRCF